MIDFDDIQAQENRRREVEVKAGRSAIETKHEESVYKDMIEQAKEDLSTSVEDEFKETVANDPMPGYNFISPATKEAHREKIERTKEWTKEQEKESERLQDLVAEADDNELKVTRTATGQPKVGPDGKTVEPMQKSDDNPNPSSKPADGVKAENKDNKDNQSTPKVGEKSNSVAPSPNK